MMAMIRKLFRPHPVHQTIEPITIADVEPAPPDPAMEGKLREAKAELAKALVKHDRRSWEVRRELAGRALSIVAGNR